LEVGRDPSMCALGWDIDLLTGLYSVRFLLYQI